MFLDKQKISSPREQALIYAYNAQNSILSGNQDAVSTLRSCLVIASLLKKTSMKQWVNKELQGYSPSDKIPGYRTLSCNKVNNFNIFQGFERFDVPYGVHNLQEHFNAKKNVYVDHDCGSLVIYQGELSQLLSTIVDKCLFFLNQIIDELQYGGTVEYLMEEIRKNTDEKLAQLDKKIVDETRSLSLNLTSTNPADWNKVAHSTRKMLKILADNVFPPQNQPYITKDKRTLEVSDDKFINRLYAFLDQKLRGRQRAFMISEIEYFEAYLHQLVIYSHRGEHKSSIEKYQADMLAVHTYLIISEVLWLCD